MRIIGLSIGIAVFLVGCAQSPEAKDRDAIVAAKSAVTRAFIDPNSVQFFEAYTSESSAGVNVCGIANGKNSLGAYAQPRRFVVREMVAIVESETPKPEFESIWNSLCDYLKYPEKMDLLKRLATGDKSALEMIDAMNGVELARRKISADPTQSNIDEKMLIAKQANWKLDLITQAKKL